MAIGQKQEEVWMDTTAEVAPFRLLAYSLRNKQALVIPPEFSSPPSPRISKKLRRHAHARSSKPADRWQDQRHRQTRSPRPLRISRRRRTHAALRFPPRSPIQLAARRRKHQQPAWAETSPTSRSAIPPPPGDLSPSPTTFPRSTSSTGRRRRRDVLPLVQFSLPETDLDDSDPDAEP